MTCLRSCLVLLTLPVLILIGLLLYPFYYIGRSIGWVKPVPDTTHNTRRDFVACSPDCLSCQSFVGVVVPHDDRAEEFNRRLTDHFDHAGSIPGERTQPEFTFLLWSFGGHSFDGADLRRCKSCGQLWELTPPENAKKGSFRAIRFKDGEYETGNGSPDSI